MDISCIAHRGYAGLFPENTLRAVRGAGVRGADLVELDVRRCADDPVVIHDATLDRVTDATGPVADAAADELASLSVYGSGEGVPRLSAVGDALPEGVGLNLELKERGVAADALAAVEGESRVLISSFDPAALREARDAAPSVPRAYLFAGDPGEALDVARDLDCEAVHPHYEACLRSDVVARAHDDGLTVNAWTVRSGVTGWLLAARGVDGLIADVPVRDRFPRAGRQ